MEEKIKYAFLKVFRDQIISIVLYGSYARAEPKPYSDIDLLIVVRELPEDRMKLHALLDNVEENLKELYSMLEEKGYKPILSPIILDIDGASKIRPLYLDIIFDAKILYDEKDFIKNVFEKLRRRLETLNAERKRLGNLWYVILKKDYRFGEVIEIE
ncbi:MAG: nucleotidyltransferase domain-containing protein [Nitrososphaeria archaeon]|nr:nucleotidyltransferase domain-containing protein [Nitrososphaeria archaeon]